MSILGHAGSASPAIVITLLAHLRRSPAAWQQNADGTRPTMRWLFQCFERIDLHHTLLPDGSRRTSVQRLTDLHRLVLRLLGPGYEIRYLVFHETAE